MSNAIEIVQCPLSFTFYVSQKQKQSKNNSMAGVMEDEETVLGTLSMLMGNACVVMVLSSEQTLLPASK